MCWGYLGVLGLTCDTTNPESRGYWQLLASAHAVDREYRVLDALRDTDVPVPDAVVLCGDDDIIGSMFYVMKHLEGRIFWDPAVPEVANAARTAGGANASAAAAGAYEVETLVGHVAAGGHLATSAAPLMAVSHPLRLT